MNTQPKGVDEMANYEKSVFLSDIHFPYEDKEAINVVIAFIRWFKPSFIFLLGDIVDFYALSKFDKDPDRALRIQDEINDAKSFFAHLRLAAPRANIVFFEGNHEARLMKFLRRNPEVSGLEVLRLPSLLSMADYNVRFVGAMETYKYHGFYLEHGDIVRKHSGYTARGMMEKRGVSGISGHTHRLGTHYTTNEGGDYVWLENGCLCDRKPDYIKSPNWQQGFSVGYFKKNNHRFLVEQVCIVNGKCVYAGREFTSTGAV